jgi:integrase
MPQQLWRRVSERTGKVSWQVKIEIGKKPDGKPKFVTKTFKKKGEAEAFRLQILRERDEGIVVEPTKLTLDAFLDRWLEVVEHRVRPVTLLSYTDQLKNHIRPALGERQIRSINGLALQAVYAQMLDDGLSARSVRYTHSILKNAFKQAIAWRLLPRNPANDVKLPKQQNQEMNVLTKTEARDLLAATKEDRLAALFDVALTTGMRPGEYMGLRWVDVDLENSRLFVRRTLSRTNKEWTFSEPKTPQSRRTIPLPPSTTAALRAHQERQAQERKDADEWNDHDLVFTTTNGEPLERHNFIKRHFLPALKKAKLGQWIDEEDSKRFVPGIRLYDLRHTCATLLLADGINAKVVSERLGHSSIVMTLDTYAHVLPTMQQDAANKLEEMLYNTDTP